MTNIIEIKKKHICMDSSFKKAINSLVHTVSVPAVALQPDHGRRIVLLVADLERQIRPELFRVLHLLPDVLDEFVNH